MHRSSQARLARTKVGLDCSCALLARALARTSTIDSGQQLGEFTKWKACQLLLSDVQPFFLTISMGIALIDWKHHLSRTSSVTVALEPILTSLVESTERFLVHIHNPLQLSDAFEHLHPTHKHDVCITHLLAHEVRP